MFGSYNNRQRARNELQRRGVSTRILSKLNRIGEFKIGTTVNNFSFWNTQSINVTPPLEIILRRMVLIWKVMVKMMGKFI
jgi:hypothetical protein